MRVGIVTEAFHIPLSQLCICRHRYHSKNGFLALYSQWDRESWFLVTAQPANIAPGCRRTADTDKGLRGSPVYGHQHGFRKQHRQQTSLWPSVATWSMDTNPDPGLQWKHKSRHVPWSINFLRKSFWNLGDGSVGKVTCHQAWRQGFKALWPMVKGLNQLPQVTLWSP